ncbi:MAG: phosphoribosylglycinamide formyltransferase [Planctomycetota bacterium]
MTKKTEQIIAYTDGASRGNPGPAAAGFVLYNQNKIQLCAKAVYVGQTTNNVAEYTALINALQAAQKFRPKNLTLYSDSELLVRQINGLYRVKSEQIRPLFQQALQLLEKFENWKLQHITRDKNKQADELVNKALNLGKDINTDSAPQTNKKPVRLGAMISGGGTTLMNILEYIKDGRLNAEVSLVISSRSTVAGVERAKAAGLNVKIIRKKDYPDIDRFSKRIEQELVAANVDLVVQGGWLCLWKIPDRYENRVMNIHPALLPSFGGQGMWGHHVHQAVINAGCKVTGCTVHFCTNDYDKGPIIVQKCCPVQENDTPDLLAKRVFEQECLAYPQAIKLFAEDRLTIRDGKAKILDSK